MMSAAWFILLWSLVELISGSKDYSDCRWFSGNQTNAPLYPIGICESHSHEGELDGLSLYSTKLECNWEDTKEVFQYEWNNTGCQGTPYHTQRFTHEDGYYFNCEAETSCPFTKVILWELRNTTSADGHNEHICAFDTAAYHEIALITNLCVDLIDEYNTSFRVDCSAKHVSYTEFSDPKCKNKTEVYGEVTEGCDDPWNINAYVQIAECDDADYHPFPVIPDTGGGTGGDTGSGDTKNDNTAIVVTIIVGIIVVALVIMIGFYVVGRKNRLNEVAAANVDQQPFNVDFQSIGDGGDPQQPQSVQQITTQGEDVQEIAIDHGPPQ